MTEQRTDLDNKFKKLFQDGKLVQVHVSKWGMCYQLSEKDIKLAPGETLPEFFRLGKKMLIEDETRNEFARLEHRARNFLKDNSFKFPIADAHFVTRKKIVPVLEQLQKFKEQYDTLTTNFIRDYEQHKTVMLEKYPDHKELIEPYYPPVAILQTKFGFSVSVFEVAFPRKIQQLSMADIHAQNESVEELKKKYESQMDSQYQSALGEMDKFIKEAVAALRGQVVEVFDTIAKKITNDEVITSKNIKSIKKIIEDFDALDFFEDTTVKAKLDAVKALVDSDLNFSDNHKAIKRLEVALNDVLTSTKDMSDLDTLTGNYFRKIDL
jgi:hypothetical protein